MVSGCGSSRGWNASRIFGSAIGRRIPAAQCGDLLVRDRLGQWTYQFAVTVDDWLEEVDLVVRGEDLLESTGRQLRLARLLGRTAPIRYLHHPLIHGPTGAKLSKANRDTGIRELRAGGSVAGGSPGRGGGRHRPPAGGASTPRRRTCP